MKSLVHLLISISMSLAIILVLNFSESRGKEKLIEAQTKLTGLQERKIKELENQNQNQLKMLEHYILSKNPGSYQINVLESVFENAGQTNVAAILTILNASVRQKDITNLLRAVGPYAIILRDEMSKEQNEVRK